MSTLELDEVHAVALATEVRVAAGVRLLVRYDDARCPGVPALELDRDDGAARTGFVTREAGVDARTAGVRPERHGEFAGGESREGALLEGRRLPVPVDPAR